MSGHALQVLHKSPLKAMFSRVARAEHVRKRSGNRYRLYHVTNVKVRNTRRVRRQLATASAAVLFYCTVGRNALQTPQNTLRPRCETAREFMDDAASVAGTATDRQRDTSAQSSWIRKRSSHSHNTHEDTDAVSGNSRQPPMAEQSLNDEKKFKASGWANFTNKFNDIQWTGISDKITDYIVPDWIKLLPSYMNKLQRELSMAPGSLAEEIWIQANDPEINPEIIWDCKVRVSDELCDEEKAFIRRRKIHTTRSLARYLGIPENDVHPDDVPTIAICGSGGGLRALVAGASSYLSTKEAGLFDCVTYTAGVSGSCWLQTIFYSSIGAQSHRRLINHLKHRLGVHIAYPPAALNLLSSAPTNKFLLSGIVEKLKGVPDADFGIVDVYGLLLAARLLIPKGELNVDAEDLKLSNQKKYIEYGQHPLPIYTAVRHEIPFQEQQTNDIVEAAAQAKKEAWFQWFEFTPYEFWCEEFQAGIPTWAIGRNFEKGQSLSRENGLGLPELRLSLLMGIWGSAFCATLSHYYKEIRPVMKGLAGFAGIDQMIEDRDDTLVRVHPIDPATIPNFVYGMDGLLPPSCPKSIVSASHLQLMDAGMSNNLPIYPLLRPGRDIDVMICFDNSADCRSDNWLGVADGYARQRGIKGWPMGIGWPPADQPLTQTAAELETAQAFSEQEAQEKPPEAKPVNQKPPPKKPADLGYCNVWIGTTAERTTEEEPPPPKVVAEDWELSQSEAGLAIIYFPLLPNPKVPGIDPLTTDFMSTWNFVYTPEQIDKCADLARANFAEGAEQTKRTIRAIYERKKAMRLEREAQEKEWSRRRKMRMGLAGRHLGEGDHADHFS